MKAYLSSFPKLSLLALLFLVVLGMHFAGHGEGIPLFVLSALSILGFVTIVGKAVEEVSVFVGPLWGGLVNASMANITELIIAITALKNVELHPVVRSSITGSILGNLLLVLGAAMVYGGAKYQVQKFSRVGAQVNVGMLWVALVCLMIPTFIHLAWMFDPRLDRPQAEALVQHSSLAASVILLLIYFLSLGFSLVTHRKFLLDAAPHDEEAEWSLPTAAVTLLMATLCVAFLSEVFVDSLNTVLHVQKVNISELFVGVVIVAIVGNASEGMVAIWVARENKMELSYQIVMGSCLQIALFVAPLLVLISYALGKPMSLAFHPLEIFALLAAVQVASNSLQDGESHWLEGAMFLGVYLFFALVFWYHP